MDIISNLPDEVLCHMMSFLPTKYAVGTSILSKRWRYTWASVPYLDFDSTLVAHPENRRTPSNELVFMLFVNRVLLLHRVPVKKLRLKLIGESGCFCEDGNSWISAAIMHNDVEELDLDYHSPQLPQMIFSCETLKILKLHAKIGFKIFDFVWLPKLKVLHLLRINASDLKKILSGSLVLEELIIHRDPTDYQRTSLSVVSPLLKRLTIHQTKMNDKLKNYNYKVVLCAPKLEFLELVDHLSNEFKVTKVSSPIKATIDVRNQMLTLLSKIPNVSVLSLSAHVVEMFLMKVIEFHSYLDFTKQATGKTNELLEDTISNQRSYLHFDCATLTASLKRISSFNSSSLLKYNMLK